MYIQNTSFQLWPWAQRTRGPQFLDVGRSCPKTWQSFGFWHLSSKNLKNRFLRFLNGSLQLGTLIEEASSEKTYVSLVFWCFGWKSSKKQCFCLKLLYKFLWVLIIFHWAIIPRLFNNEIPASVLWSPFLYTKNDISGYLLKCVLQLSPGSRAQTFQIITKLKFQQMSYRVFYCPKKGSLALADSLHAMLLQVPWPLHSLLMLAWLTKFTCIATILWCDIAWSPFTYTIPFALEQVLAGMLEMG